MESDQKPSANYSALKTFMATKGRKNSEANVTEAVYATRPMRKGGRRYSCMVIHRIDDNLFTKHYSQSVLPII